MSQFWCWLFWSCATPTPAPAPAVVVPEPPPAIAAQAQPGPADTVTIAPSGGAAPAQADATAPPVSPPQPPEPPAAVHLTLTPPTLPATGYKPESGATEAAKPPTPPAPEVPTGPPAWQRYAVAAPNAGGRPTLTVVIDDMGVNQPQTARAIALPGPLTLAWLPYAPRLAEQVAAGTAHGHETILHMPMEPLGRSDPGPDALRTWLPPATNLANLRAALDRVPTAVALNQHEGSVASLSVPLMDLVMGELKARRMAFLDSVTIPHSVGLARAESAGLPARARDAFIDNDANPVAIHARLADVEATARRSGHAILIGHARQSTIDVLEQYLPTVAARGFVLWPLSADIAAGPRPRATADRAAPGSAIRTAAGASEVVIAPAENSSAE